MCPIVRDHKYQWIARIEGMHPLKVTFTPLWHSPPWSLALFFCRTARHFLAPKQCRLETKPLSGLLAPLREASANGTVAMLICRQMRTWKGIKWIYESMIGLLYKIQNLIPTGGNKHGEVLCKLNSLGRYGFHKSNFGKEIFQERRCSITP